MNYFYSAAVGVASGLGMYLISGVAAAGTILVLRVGTVKEKLQKQSKRLLKSKRRFTVVQNDSSIATRDAPKTRAAQESEQAPRKPHPSQMETPNLDGADLLVHDEAEIFQELVTARRSNRRNETDTIKS